MFDQSIDFDLFLQNQGYNHPQAIPILIEVYYAEVCRLMASLLPGHLDGIAVSQAVMESVAIHLADYQPGTNFAVWLYAQAVETARSYWQNSNEIWHPLPRTENSLEDLIRSLPWGSRVPLILRYVHQFKAPEIANILGLPSDKALESIQQARLEIKALQQTGISASWELHHREFRELFSFRLDGDITKEQIADLEHHMAVCSRCASYLGEIEKTHTLLAAELPRLWPEWELEAPDRDHIIRKISERMHLKRLLHQSTQTVRGSGLFLVPLVVFVLLVWTFNYFVSTEDLPGTPIAAQPRSTSTPLPAMQIASEPQVIQVVARRSPPGFFSRGSVGTEPAISTDGQWVVFSSNFPLLVEDDANLYTTFVYLASTDNGLIERVSVTNRKASIESPRVAPDISADGNMIIFLSSVTQVEGRNCAQEGLLLDECVGLYLFDRNLDETRLLAIMSGSKNILSPVISGNGRWVAYWSSSTIQAENESVVCGDPHGCLDIYLLDLQSNKLTRIPVGRPTSIYQENFYALDISSDGQRLVFPVLTQDWIYSELSGSFSPGVLINMFVYDQAKAYSLPVNVSPDGLPGDGPSTSARISGDGRTVVFASTAQNMTADDPEPGPNLYLRDLQSGQVERIEAARHGDESPNTLSESGLIDRWFNNMAISEDGQVLVFLSADDRSSQTNNRMCSSAWVGRNDCYRLILYNRIDKTSHEVAIGVDRLFEYGDEGGKSTHPGISADGSKLVFVGHSLNCMGDTCPQVFFHDTNKRETTPVRYRANHFRESQWTFLNSLEGHNGWVNSVAYSPDGEFLASGGADGEVRLWRTDNWNPVASLGGHTRPVTNVVFSPNGRYLVTGGLDGLVRIWWLPGYLVQELDCIPGEVLSLAISPDGRSLAVGTSNGIHLLRLAGRRFGPCQRAVFLPLSVNTLVYSPDGLWLAIGSKDDGKVRLYQLPDGKRIYELAASQGRILALAFSPDGKLLASASEQNDVNLWDLSFEGNQFDVAYRETIWHVEWVKGLVFSKDGTLLVTGSFDNAIRLWDIQRRALVQTLWRTRQDQVLSLAFSPDGNGLASGSVQGVVRLWGLPSYSQPQNYESSYFIRNSSDMMGYLYAKEPRSQLILGSGWRSYLSVNDAAESLPFDIKIPMLELPRLTPTIVYTWQARRDGNPNLILNYIYTTDYQPSYLTIRQGLEKSQVYNEVIGASAVVQALQIGTQPAEYVHGDWSVEDNSMPFVNNLIAPRMRWDMENGSHWLRWKAGEIFISLEFHTPFSDRMIEDDERVTKELILAIAESFLPLKPER